jgi:molybdopterin converting factor small subunit
MKIEVLVFARLKELLGTDREVLDVDDGETVKVVVARLLKQARWSDAASLPLSYAVNEEFVGENHELRDGDRLALLTPVSGG